MTPGNRKPSSDREPHAVTAPTLKEALRKVRQRYGPDAQLLRSRTVQRAAGLGQHRYVEVTVGAPETERYGAATRPRAVDGGVTAAPAADPIAREVDRLEELVERLVADLARGVGDGRGDFGADEAAQDHPLTTTLIAAGTSPRVAAGLLLRYGEDNAARGREDGDLGAYLRRQLKTAEADWTDLRGTHVFLGDEGCGKSETVLAAAAKLQSLGRKTLVLNLLPRHAGEIRRLQHEASRRGYDAAILQRPEQLEQSWPHLERYEVVLIDTPPLQHPDLAGSGALQHLIGQNAALHRHLVVPLDADLEDGAKRRRAVSRWHCDWLALTRIDRTRRPGRLVDLMLDLTLPVSFLTQGSWPARRIRIASGDLLLRVILGAEPAAAGSASEPRGGSARA